MQLLQSRASLGSAQRATTQRSRRSWVVAALQRPGQSSQPDPFDRHSSPRDKAAASSSRAQSKKGANFAKESRRRGRPAHLRSPDDSPLRDGNRDRLIGLLTERAARTLLVYLQETNPSMYHWLHAYIKDNPIPLIGAWDEVSGDAFMRKMLSASTETTAMGRNEYLVDPRQMAQRLMEVRLQLSREFIQELGLISDENTVLLRETLQVSLSNTLTVDPTPKLPPRDVSKVFVHPELLVDGQAGSSTLHPEVAQSHPELLPVVKKQAELKAAATAPPAAPAETQPVELQLPQGEVPTPGAPTAAIADVSTLQEQPPAPPVAAAAALPEVSEPAVEIPKPEASAPVVAAAASDAQAVSEGAAPAVQALQAVDDAVVAPAPGTSVTDAIPTSPAPEAVSVEVASAAAPPSPGLDSPAPAVPEASNEQASEQPVIVQVVASGEVGAGPSDASGSSA